MALRRRRDILREHNGGGRAPRRTRADILTENAEGRQNGSLADKKGDQKHREPGARNGVAGDCRHEGDHHVKQPAGDQQKSQPRDHPDRRIAERHDRVGEELELLVQGPLASTGPAGLLDVRDGRLPETDPQNHGEETGVFFRNGVVGVDHFAIDEQEVGPRRRHVGEPQSAHQLVVHAGQKLRAPRLAHAPSADRPHNVITVAPAGKQLGNRLRRVLKVGGQEDGTIAAALGQSRGIGGMRPGITRQPDVRVRGSVLTQFFAISALPSVEWSSINTISQSTSSSPSTASSRSRSRSRLGASL